MLKPTIFSDLGEKGNIYQRAPREPKTHYPEHLVFWLCGLPEDRQANECLQATSKNGLKRPGKHCSSNTRSNQSSWCPYTCILQKGKA